MSLFRPYEIGQNSTGRLSSSPPPLPEQGSPFGQKQPEQPKTPETPTTTPVGPFGPLNPFLNPAHLAQLMASQHQLMAGQHAHLVAGQLAAMAGMAASISGLGSTAKEKAEEKAPQSGLKSLEKEPTSDNEEDEQISVEED